MMRKPVHTISTLVGISVVILYLIVDLIIRKLEVKEKMKLKLFTLVYRPGFNQRVLFLFLALFLNLYCTGPRMYVQPDADFSYIKKVAVLPFTNFTNDKFAGDKVRDVVTTEILIRGFFYVIERGEVSRVLREEGKASATYRRPERLRPVPHAGVPGQPHR